VQDKWVQAYMDTASRFAELSSAQRLKVGACVVKDHRIISIGYNGMPAGWDNNCEEYEMAPEGYDAMWYQDNRYRWKPYGASYAWVRLKTKEEVIHAEANAIIKLARDGEGGNDASLFCTHAPCIQCAKLIAGTGIKKVYYREQYRKDNGVSFLTNSGIQVEKVK